MLSTVIFSTLCIAALAKRVDLAQHAQNVGVAESTEQASSVAGRRNKKWCNFFNADCTYKIGNKCETVEKCANCKQCKKKPALGVKPQRSGDKTVKPTVEEVKTEPKVPEQCDDHLWIKTGVLGAGAHGEVLEVRKVHSGDHNFDDGKRYGLKSGFTKDDQADLVKERGLMANAQCDGGGVPVVYDQRPCKLGSKTGKIFHLPYAMVMEKYAGKDLQKWLDRHWHDGKKETCGGQIAQKLISGLNCLHGSGYIHDDLKPDNVFLGVEDANGCPTDVVIADYGLAEPVKRAGIDNVAGYFDSSGIHGSGHLPADLFGNWHYNNLKIMQRRGYKVTPDIDWCSYIYMMQEDFDMKPSEWNVDGSITLDPKSCGPMGGSRAVMLDQVETE